MFSKQLSTFLKREKNKTLVFTNGCFDLLHPGHVQYLKDARNLGDLLIVGLNTDSSVKKLKGEKRPINNERDRKLMLESLASVDFVEPFAEDTPLKLIEFIKPSVLVKGGDYEIKDIVGSTFVLNRGGKVKSLTFLDGYSSSELIKKIKNS